jgi:rare lipoprotein A
VGGVTQALRWLLLAALLCLAAGAVLPVQAESGLASWYSGGGTACGDRTVAPHTAAHRSLPCGTVVLVTAWHSGRSTTVTIRDRGPFIRGRIIDVSPDAARELGLIGPGVLPVSIERVR